MCIYRQAFYTLHVMYHEATACHVTGDIVDLLTILLHILETGKECHDKKGSIPGHWIISVAYWLHTLCALLLKLLF